MVSLPFLISAQSKEYAKGYIVKVQGDTINGFIKDEVRSKIGHKIFTIQHSNLYDLINLFKEVH